MASSNDGDEGGREMEREGARESAAATLADLAERPANVVQIVSTGGKMCKVGSRK